MKIMTRFFVLLLFIALFSGCNRTSAPKAAFQKFNTAIKASDWSTVWDMLSYKTQKAFEDEGYKRMKETIANMPPELKKEKVPELGVTYEELLKISPKNFFILIMNKTSASKEFIKNSANEGIERVSVKNNCAKLKIKDKNEVATLVLEGGNWKIEFEEY